MNTADALRLQQQQYAKVGRRRQPLRTPAPPVAATERHVPVTFEIPYPPSVNHAYATVRGRRVLSREGREYKAKAADMARAAGVVPIADGEVRVILAIYRPKRIGDLDNRIKLCLDSLKGVAWTDDSQVKHIDAERFEDKANPRAVVRVEKV